MAVASPSRAVAYTRSQRSAVDGGGCTSDAKLNAQMLTDALGGEKGPVADCLMLNAGVAMAAADQAASVEEGVADSARVTARVVVGA